MKMKMAERKWRNNVFLDFLGTPSSQVFTRA